MQKYGWRLFFGGGAGGAGGVIRVDPDGGGGRAAEADVSLYAPIRLRALALLKRSAVRGANGPACWGAVEAAAEEAVSFLSIAPSTGGFTTSNINVSGGTPGTGNNPGAGANGAWFAFQM